MNPNHSNSDKITIKVRHSDEDYHDISIDWSKECFELREQFCQQLQVYIGIPGANYKFIEVSKGNDLTYIISNEYEAGQRDDWAAWQDTKEQMMSIIQDGDCFLLHVKIEPANGISCIIYLLHQDVINEAECNHRYCLTKGSRAYTNKISRICTSDYFKAKQDDPNITYKGYQLINSNIKHMRQFECRGSLLVNQPIERRIYANYLRHRG